MEITRIKEKNSLHTFKDSTENNTTLAIFRKRNTSTFQSEEFRYSFFPCGVQNKKPIVLNVKTYCFES